MPGFQRANSFESTISGAFATQMFLPGKGNFSHCLNVYPHLATEPVLAILQRESAFFQE